MQTFTCGLDAASRDAIEELARLDDVTLGEAVRKAVLAQRDARRPTWAARLRVMREGAGLSQVELAEALGVTRTTVSNAEQERFAVTEAMRAWIVTREKLTASIKAEAGTA